MDNKSSLQDAHRITIIGFIVNLLLGVVKIFFGVIGRSQALFADGIHSLSDLLTDTLVLVASYFGGQNADRDHPYGHARIETAATIILAILLLLAGIGIIYDAIWNLVHNTVTQPSPYVLAVAALSIFSNEWLYHATLQVGKRNRSALLVANAWHHRSDAASSAIVMVGVIGALLGYTYLDAVAAIIVGFMIGKMALSLGLSSFRELIDTAVDEKTLESIANTINKISGVREIHQLRTRFMGGDIFVDVHVLVDPKLTVSEGHHVSQLVHQALLNDIETISDVTVHIDPEDDEIAPPSLHLPPRHELLPILYESWKNLPGANKLNKIGLHYLDGKVYVDVYLPLELATNPEDAKSLAKEYAKMATDNQLFAEIEVFYF